MLDLGYLAPASLHSLYRCNLHFQPFLEIHPHKLDETTHHSHHHIVPSLPVRDKIGKCLGYIIIKPKIKANQKAFLINDSKNQDVQR